MFEWKELIEYEKDKNYYIELKKVLDEEYSSGIVYPPRDLIFNAFRLTNFNDVKVVILGQDPYHNEGEAMGLTFSVPNGIDVPPSLKNIFKEIETDTGIKSIIKEGDLTPWAKQGILLLNASLTVRKNEPMSHSKIGWDIFTDMMIKHISKHRKNVVFLLWGSFAKSKKHLIDNKKHLILETSHPSPLGSYRGFIGSKCFSQTNNYLKENNITEIDW